MVILSGLSKEIEQTPDIPPSNMSFIGMEIFAEQIDEWYYLERDRSTDLAKMVSIRGPAVGKEFLMKFDPDTGRFHETVLSDLERWNLI